MKRSTRYLVLTLACALLGFASQPTFAQAQKSSGPLLPHVGLEVTTTFHNVGGRDAESYLTFTAVIPSILSIVYSSSRGLVTKRDIRVVDRQSFQIYVIGYAPNMPLVIPGTTSGGISLTSLAELRTKGRAALSLIYDANLSKVDGEIGILEKDTKVDVIVEDRSVGLPALHARGTFRSGNETATGDFYFLDNVNNPAVLQSTIKFNSELDARTERVTRISAGQRQRSAMEQALNTLGRYDHYGIHFDSGTAYIRPDTASMVADIATTLKNYPTWRLKITGHTDSIGGTSDNIKLSGEPAAAVKAALVARGIASNRLQSAGAGESQPKGDNSTLQGRALNRRVEIVRTDK